MQKRQTELVVLAITYPSEWSNVAEAQQEDPEIKIILEWTEESEVKPTWQDKASNNIAVKTYRGL